LFASTFTANCSKSSEANPEHLQLLKGATENRAMQLFIAVFREAKRVQVKRSLVAQVAQGRKI